MCKTDACQRSYDRDMTSIVRKSYKISVHTTKVLQMNLKLNKNIDLTKVKADLKNKLSKGSYKTSKSFEVTLIYKIIHEFSNYEDHMWGLYSYEKDYFQKEMSSLLASISKLDQALAWDCLDVLERYKNVYEGRHKLEKKYLKVS